MLLKGSVRSFTGRMGQQIRNTVEINATKLLP
jgi:hypothetical protein